jgi:hypothetical protein
MPQTFTLTDGTTPLTIVLPTSWADVTLETFLRLNGADELGMLAIFTGLDRDTMGRLAADDALYLANALAFAADITPILEQPADADLAEVGASPYGVLLLATAYVESLPEGTPGMAASPYLYALYRCQQLYGKVDDAKVEAMRLAVLAEPVAKVYANCAFFLNSYKRATSATPRAQTKGKSPDQKKKRQDWKSLVKRLVRSSH